MIFLLNTEKLSFEFCLSAYNGICHHFQYQNDKKTKKESLCGKLLLTYVLYKYFNERDFTVKRTDTEKPYLCDSKLFFNISHSGNYVVCSVSDYEIGCDIQLISSYNERVVNRFYHKNERELLAVSENKSRDFIKLWTLKESILKKEGKGLSGGLDTYDFSHYISSDSFSACGLHFVSFYVNDAYLSVCSEKAESKTVEIEAEKIIDFFKGKG